MNPLEHIARLLAAGGVFLLLLGGVVFLMGRYGMSWRLPGDIFIHKGNFSFFFPIVTCILLSIVLTVIVNIIGRR